VTIHQYFDHNVSRVLAGSLRSQGFGVTTAQQLGLEQATDAKQFLTAVERGWSWSPITKATTRNCTTRGIGGVTRGESHAGTTAS
jgi:hypothetical protein